MEIVVQPLVEAQVPEAERIFRLAFGTYGGLADPLTFSGDCGYARTRWLVNREAALAALAGGELIGSIFAARWGSFAFFGPLTVRPAFWDRGVARRLLDPTMRRFEAWGVTQAGLYTFADSPKHAALYQRYGFALRFITAITAKAVAVQGSTPRAESFSALAPAQRAACLAQCRAVTEALYPGLDLTSEIEAVQAHALGDTVLETEGSEVSGFAVCQVGPGTEAGSGTCQVKFAAVRPSPRAAAQFERLLDALERFAAQRGAGRVVIAVNTACEGAYQAVLGRGFRTFIQGVVMQRPNEEGFHRRAAFVLDDLR